MDNKKLNEQELEQITGGQNIMPVIFSGTKQDDEQILNAGYIKVICPNPSCKFEMHLPPIYVGKQVTCAECQTVFTVEG